MGNYFSSPSPLIPSPVRRVPKPAPSFTVFPSPVVHITHHSNRQLGPQSALLHSGSVDELLSRELSHKLQVGLNNGAYLSLPPNSPHSRRLQPTCRLMLPFLSACPSV